MKIRSRVIYGDNIASFEEEMSAFLKDKQDNYNQISIISVTQLDFDLAFAVLVIYQTEA